MCRDSRSWLAKSRSQLSCFEGRALLLIIGLDCDGILSDLMPYWLSAYNSEYNDCLLAQHCVRWETHRIVKPECGLRIYDYLRAPGFLQCVPLIAGAKHGVHHLTSIGHEVIAVTDTPGESVKDRLIWLSEHFPSIPPKNYIITPRKDLVQVDLLVGDAPHNITAARCPAVIFDHPYNQKVPGPRVRNWDELLAYIEAFGRDRKKSA